MWLGIELGCGGFLGGGWHQPRENRASPRLRVWGLGQSPALRGEPRACVSRALHTVGLGTVVFQSRKEPGVIQFSTLLRRIELFPNCFKTVYN